MIDPVTLEQRGRVGILSLRPPDACNALAPADVRKLRLTLERLPRDIDAVVIIGDGAAFSGGVTMPPSSTLLSFWSMMRQWRKIARTATRGRVVTIAAVNGLAVCGGFELLLHCDLAVVARDAHVLDQHVKFGLHPGAGASTIVLPRRLGRQRALWHLVTGEPLSPDRLVELGLAIEVCEPDELLERAVSIGQLIASRPHETVLSVRRCLNRHQRPWAPLMEAVSVVRNNRRLKGAGADHRAERLEENRRVVESIAAARAQQGA